MCGRERKRHGSVDSVTQWGRKNIGIKILGEISWKNRSFYKKHKLEYSIKFILLDHIIP